MEYCCICGRNIAACNCAYSSGTWKTVLYRTAWNGTDYNDYNTGTYTVTYYPNVKDGAWNIGKKSFTGYGGHGKYLHDTDRVKLFIIL